jgi:N-acetyl-anhydromuramyl-L-alanine amidase AmpD
MGTTIHYDKHVKDLIDELSDTGHVYHTKYKKKSVTFHHNAGNLTFEDVLRVWTFNKASAHFDSDASGDIAQYVEVHEYAWAVGDTEGNKETISIELANKTGAPKWEVAEVTWKSGARLAGFLFAHVIDEAPTHNNVLLHNHWSATTCPGPFIHSIYNQLLDEVQHWYKHFMDEKNKKAETEPKPQPEHRQLTKSEQIIESIQKLLDLKVVDGKWGPHTDAAFLAFRKKHLNNF